MAAALPILKVVSAATGIFSALKGAPKAKAAPEVKKPKTAPATDDKAAQRASQMKTQRKYAGAGRSGTILSQGSKLG